MQIITPLITKEQAEKIIEFFFSHNAFQQVWAPGEKNLVKHAVLQSLKDRSTHTYWFLEDKGIIIGAIGVRENHYQSGGFEMVDDYFAVHERYRKQGIESQLLQTVEEFVRKHHGRYIHIISCDTPYYKPAQHFYKKHGYKKVGEIPDYYNVGEGRVDYFKKIEQVKK